MKPRPKCRAGHYKTQRKIQAEHSDINHSNISYDPHPRVMKIKAKINK